MTAFREQYELLNALPAGRYDCPFCNHSKCLSVSKEGAKLMWHCFHAACDVKGVHRGELTIEEMRNDSKKVHLEKPWEVPHYFTSIRNHPECLRYLRHNHALWAYEKRLIDVNYDPRLNRTVFISPSISPGNAHTAGVGRTMGFARPKWYRYGDIGVPYRIGHSPTGILVEDAPSACAVTPLGLSGVALLGTNLQASYMPYLRGYKRLIVALDRDAARKSIDIARKIGYICPEVTVRLLDRDLKLLEPSEIEKVLQL